MLEIIILINLTKNIGKIVEAKGRKKGGYQLMVVGLWIGGEIFGAIVGGILAAIVFEESEGGEQLLVYAFALGGAILGAVTAFLIAKNVAPLDDDEAALRLQGVDVEGWKEPFKASGSTAHAPDDAVTDSPERSRQSPDDRFQH